MVSNSPFSEKQPHDAATLAGKVHATSEMTIRAYHDGDWESVREIYDLSKPDEMRGSVDLRAIIPIADDPKALRLFQESDIIVMEEDGKVLGFA